MATSVHVDPSTKDVSSVPLMMIQATNYYVEGEVSQYPEELKMLIVALKNSILSTAMFNSFSVPMSWLSQAGSTATYNKASDTITFHLVNDKKVSPHCQRLVTLRNLVFHDYGISYLVFFYAV
ncbi:unnamed protein product [Lactuca virosa]|uniref:Uncharacterized protein n=1 Tax=Lactuca virosa TaxID=75947 RepID=A0AAU9MJ19_9ASTR|nr:unnamed protein product [Lactuca virosa]